MSNTILSSPTGVAVEAGPGHWPKRTDVRVGVPRLAETDLYRLMAHGEQLRLKFESRVGFETIVDRMTNLPAEYIDGSIDTYRQVIRRNRWFFPTVTGDLADVRVFLRLWNDVHTNYFKVAVSIFDVIQTDGLGSLANPGLYSEVIASETSRGWVGKRSPIGPDIQIDRRAERIEELLTPFMPFDDIDQLLDLGGALPGTTALRSAEEDMTAALAEVTEYQSGHPDGSKARMRLLRDYCKYSEGDLEKKVRAFSCCVPAKGPTLGSLANLDQLLDRLPLLVRADVVAILDEIRTLNHLNLNLEPRHSFKGWAGLMHGLVFSIVRDLPGMSDDIYHNLNNLKEKQ